MSGFFIAANFLFCVCVCVCVCVCEWWGGGGEWGEGDKCCHYNEGPLYMPVCLLFLSL